MKRFCPKCGKEINDTNSINNFCIDCYLQDHNIIIIPKIELTICPRCGRIKFRTKWYNNFEDIEDTISKNVKVIDLGQAKVDTKLNIDLDKKEYSADITVKTILKNKFLTLKKQAPVIIKKDICLSCSRLSGSYYTTILQLRYDDKKIKELISDKILEEVRNISDALNSRSTKLSSNIHIVKELPQKTGTDLYLDNNKLAFHIVQHLMKHKSAKSNTTSKTLVGVDKNGERIYRTTFCIHFGEN